jgi:hypothetical protein
MAERRRLERFELKAPARVLVELDSSQRVELELLTKNLSSDGAYLISAEPLPEGASVRVELVLALDALRKIAGDKGQAKVRIRGRVIRVDGSGAAIRFASRYKITALGTGTGTGL